MAVNQRATDRANLNVATGSRLADPSADVAGTAIADQLKSQISSLGAAKMNAGSGGDIAAVAEGALSEQSTILTRMRELAVQSASDTYSDVERAMMQREFSEIRDEADRIAKTTTFGEKKLLDGSNSKFEFQVGTTGGAESRITLDSDSNTTADNLTIDGASVSSKGDARDSLEKIDKGLQVIALQRASYGAAQSRLESAENSIAANVESLSKARSQIADADVAKEVSDLRRGQILQQYQTSMLQQVNDQAGLGLKLIG
jgi:flagellin